MKIIITPFKYFEAYKTFSQKNDLINLFKPNDEDLFRNKKIL
jgi:hypothetical protein